MFVLLKAHFSPYVYVPVTPAIMGELKIADQTSILLFRHGY